MVFAPYILLATIVLGLNIVPVLMPPTWVVLAFFVLKYKLQIIPVVIIGASFATVGRIILAQLSTAFFRKFLPKSSQANYASVGDYLNKRRKITIPLVIAYAFLPIPSNHVFIAAGLAKMRINVLAASFFVGRLISYTFWISVSHKLADNLIDIFGSHYTKAGSVVIEVAGLLFLYFLGTIGWKKILKRIEK